MKQPGILLKLFLDFIAVSLEGSPLIHFWENSVSALAFQ